MRVFRPDYYDKFNCIAGECDFTCCRDWTIAVDEQTRDKWKSFSLPEEMLSGEGVVEGRKSNRKEQALTDYTFSQDNQGEEQYSIRLNEQGICPFLNDKGLCRLVLKYGEECISHTCHTFPRERHEYADRVEYTLSPGCKSVLDLLWSGDKFKIIDTDDENEQVDQWAGETPEYQFMIRNWFMEIASDVSLSPTDAIKIIFYLALELNEKEEKEQLTESVVTDYMNSDIVLQLKNALFEVEDSPVDTFMEDNELLLDIADNYRKKKIYTDYLKPIALRAEFFEKLDEDYDLESKLSLFDKVWNRFESEMRTLVCEEIYSSCLLPDSTVALMTLKLEWLALEYAVIKQWMFLKWDIKCMSENSGSNLPKPDYTHTKLTLSDLSEVVAVIFRMTGYSDDDIEEYMENSFESVIWDWGYMNFII